MPRARTVRGGRVDEGRKLEGSICDVLAMCSMTRGEAMRGRPGGADFGPRITGKAK